MPKQKDSSNNKFIVLVVLTILAMLVVFTNLSGSQAHDVPEVLGKQSTPNDEIIFWENFLVSNPTYIEGWVELADLLYANGEADYAEGAFNTARAINPNHESVAGSK